MIPVARTANILITEVDNEVMIYDRERDDCHCLNPIATKVYYYADGRNTVDDIATFLEQELELSEDVDIRGLVWLALEELEKCHLLKEYIRKPLPNVLEMSRRKVLGKTTKLAGAAAIGTLFPMIQSVIAPKPASAHSQFPPNKPPTPPPTPPCPKTTPLPTVITASGNTNIEAFENLGVAASMICNASCVPCKFDGTVHLGAGSSSKVVRNPTTGQWDGTLTTTGGFCRCL